MSKLSPDAIVDAFKNLTLSEITEFRKIFEETFDVTADVPAVVFIPPTEEVVVEEQTEFDVTLESAGEKKIQVIKTVREITQLGLKEAKDFVDSAPKPVPTLQGVDKVTAEAARDKLVAAGAKVTIK